MDDIAGIDNQFDVSGACRVGVLAKDETFYYDFAREADEFDLAFE